MHAIANDRPADGESILRLAVFLIAHVVDVAGEPFAARREERRAVELVRATACDGIHEQPAKVALPHVERCEQHLVLADRLEADRLAARLPSRLSGFAEPE